MNAEILIELLKIEGAECTICENGERLLNTFEQSAPGEYDMILMDVQLPVMKAMRQQKQSAEVHINWQRRFQSLP